MLNLQQLHVRFMYIYKYFTRVTFTDCTAIVQKVITADGEYHANIFLNRAPRTSKCESLLFE